MVEMRWALKTESNPFSSQYDKEIAVLQYRYQFTTPIHKLVDWSEWIDAPTVEEGK